MRVPGQPAVVQETEEDEVVEEEETEEEETEDGDAPDEAEIDTDGDAPEPEAEPEVEQPSYYQPPVGETPEMARLREKLADPDIAADLQAAIAAEVSRATASAMAGQSHMTAIAAERPALWKAYGRDASAIMAAQTPEQRARPEQAEGALLLAALGPHMGKPTYAAALSKYTALYNNEEAPPETRQRPAKTPIPAAQRAPSPSSRGTGASHQSRAQREMQSRFGMSARAFADLEEDLV